MYHFMKYQLIESYRTDSKKQIRRGIKIGSNKEVVFPGDSKIWIWYMRLQHKYEKDKLSCFINERTNSTLTIQS